MMSRLALWLALRIVRAVAMLVPAAGRADWRREWDAELQHYWAHLRHRRNLTWRMNMDLIRRALGSLPDAAWIRRQFTLDADAVHDAAHAVRMLLKTPGFTAIALLVFMIGIGATTAMVSVADTLFMRPLPFPGAERIMTVWQVNRATGLGRQDVAPGNALDWMKRARSFDAVAMADPYTVGANIDGPEPEQLGGARVSEQFFKVFAASMQHGRTFLPEEYQRGGPRAVILSHGLWRDRFGADADIVGKPLRLNANRFESYTVVGVMPPGFELRPFDNRWPQPEPLLWLPKQGVQDFEPGLRGRGYWNVFGRLAPGVSLDQARAEFDTLSAQLAREYPNTNKNLVAEVVPLREHLAGGLRVVLPFLLGAAAILLTVACANVANLLLAHGVGRAREFAVRQAVGASRARLVRQMLMESLLLAAAGGALGLALARWILDVIAGLRPLDAARVDQIPIDVRGALIACGVTLVAAIIAGLAPAIQLTRSSAVGALREGRTSLRRGARSALVVLEVAAAVVLAVGAGLLVRSFLLIQQVDPGFRPDHVATLQIFRGETREKRIVFFQQAVERMRAVPGVVAAGAVSVLPFGLANLDTRLPLAVAGDPAKPGDEGLVYTTVVGGDYFGAMGIPIIKGRLFEPTDTATSRQVVVVSRSLAQALWPDSDPIGSKVQTQFTGIKYDAEVVGIVGEVRHDTLERPGRAEVFIPHAQSNMGQMTFVVRTAPGSRAPFQALKEQVWALDPLQPFYATATLDQLISRSLMGRRFNLFLLGSFAIATLLLASAGVYGVMSFSTSQRTREFGVRLALGAKRRDIVTLVLGDGLKLVGLGVIVGIAMALLLTRLLRALLFGVTASDPMTFLSVCLALVLAAVAACYVPASRALKVDPAEALRTE